MDRPPSQLGNPRPSGLKAPSSSRLPMSAMTRPLQDMTQSELNSKTARDGSTMLPPPAPTTSGGKHKMAGSVSESAPKRKTLVERAGEPLQASRSHMPQPRSYGTTTRPANTARPANTSHYGNRPTSTYAKVQHAANTRHASAKDWENQSNTDDDDDYTGKRKGVPFLSLSPRNITIRKSRNLGCLSQSHPLPSRTKSQHHGSLSVTYSHEQAAGRRWSEREVEVMVGRESRAAAVQEQDCVDKVAALVLATPERHDMAEQLMGWEPTRGSNIDRTRRQASPSKLPKLVPARSHTPSTPLPSLSRTGASHTPYDPVPSVLSRKDMTMPFSTPRSCTEKQNQVFFATKSSLTPFVAWDTAGRLQDMDKFLLSVQQQMNETANSRAALEETISVYKTRVEELNITNRELAKDHRTAVADLERARTDLHSITVDLEQARRDHVRDQSDLERISQQRIHDLELQHDKQLRQVEREGERAVEDLEKEVKATHDSLEKQQQSRIADLTTEHWEELDRLKAEHDKILIELRQEIDALKRSDEGRAAESATTVQGLRENITSLQSQVELLKDTVKTSKSHLAAAEARHAVLEQEKANLVSKTHFLEGNQEAQSEEFSNMTRRLQVAEATAAAVTEQLRKEETVRRRLNAQILELKGNIRVFARVRPVLPTEEAPAKIDYPDADELDGAKEMLVHAPTTFSATGKERNEKHSFDFDRVFGPSTTNQQVFEDCRELVQSVIDGYNVSILSYGQTGSGKTFGMSGVDGIIPNSIEFLLSEIHRLKQKGWDYVVEASFVEVYNEMLNDLLGDAKTWEQDDDTRATTTRAKSKAKHEIHHDASTGKTTVSNLTAVVLWPPPDNDASWPPAVELSGDQEVDSSKCYTQNAVTKLLDTATKNRRVAATKANERSSRSHSVFVLTLKGSCASTNEHSEGILNLVDLAGSERLKHSGAEGGRAKETAAINTSLKSLGDVIEKVGSGGHVPYRNSKLTYLLQSSLGGSNANGKSSRTLMLLHLSPLQAHWPETKTSLQFGTKVHGTHIGTAKKR